MAKRPYDPSVHYNHCAQCGDPIMTEKERNSNLDEDGYVYHYACVQEPEMARNMQEDEDNEDIMS